MGNAIKKDVIHAEGIDIGIYTSDYENEFISLTDIAKKKESIRDMLYRTGCGIEV